MLDNLKVASQIINVESHTSHGIFHTGRQSFGLHLTSPHRLRLSFRQLVSLACEEPGPSPSASAHQHTYQLPCPATITGLLSSRAHRRPALTSTQYPVPLYSLHFTRLTLFTSRYRLSTSTAPDAPRHAHLLRPSRGLLLLLLACRKAPSTCIEDTPRHYRTTWLRPRNHRGRAGALPAAPQGAAAGGRT